MKNMLNFILINKTEFFSAIFFVEIKKKKIGLKHKLNRAFDVWILEIRILETKYNNNI